MPKYKLYTGKWKKSNKFNRLQIEVFFFPYINSINGIKRINGILRYTFFVLQVAPFFIFLF